MLITSPNFSMTLPLAIIIMQQDTDLTFIVGHAPFK